MILNFIFGTCLVLFTIAIAASEVTYVNGSYSALVLLAASITAFYFAMAKMNERQRLAEAAEAYLKSLSEDERVRLNSESIELRGFGLESKITGRRLVSDNLIILVPGLMFAGFMYYHHVITAELLVKVLEATTENTYVLSLPQTEREKLNIAMPESLRRKLRQKVQEP